MDDAVDFGFVGGEGGGVVLGRGGVQVEWECDVKDFQGERAFLKVP